MKIYLINPPAPERYIREGRCMQKSGVWTTLWPPLTLALCASVLEEEGFEVKLDDCSAMEMTFQSMKDEVARFVPDLLVMATATPSLMSDLESVKLLKDAFPALKTAALGVHVTVFTKETMNQCPHLDFVVRGEPEYILRDCALSLRDGKGQGAVEGLAWRDKKAVVINAERPFMDNLEKMPFPAWHLVDRTRYLIPLSRKPFLSVFSARGCPYGCIFCADDPYYGKKIRRRSAARVVDEIVNNTERFGVHDFLFWTESFTASRELVLGVCEEIEKRKLAIRWFCNSRVDHVDKELLMAMKKSGCQMISFGIESFSPEVLKAVKKGTTPEQAVEAVMLTHQCGIQVIAHCILGLPGDTEERMRHTVEQILKLPVDYAQFYAAVPFPGSELYDMAVEKGWLSSSPDWKDFEQETCLLSLSPDMPPEKVRKIRDDAYRRFYLRPKFIVSFIRNFLRQGSVKALCELWRSFGASLLGKKK